MKTSYPYRDLARLARFLTVLLVLGAVVAAVSLGSSIMEAKLLSHEDVTDAELEKNDVRAGIIGLVDLALYLFTVIVFARWILQANRNVIALGSGFLRMTPGWAVGFFFVPIWCLWKPYQAMKDLWKASHDPASWHTVRPGPILATWWTLWLSSNFLGYGAARMDLRADTVEELATATAFEIAANLVQMPLCLVAIELVRQITRAQAAHVPSSLAPTLAAAGSPSLLHAPRDHQ